MTQLCNFCTCMEIAKKGKENWILLHAREPNSFTCKEIAKNKDNATWCIMSIRYSTVATLQTCQTGMSWVNFLWYLTVWHEFNNDLKLLFIIFFQVFLNHCIYILAVYICQVFGAAFTSSLFLYQDSQKQGSFWQVHLKVSPLANLFLAKSPFQEGNQARV